MKVRDKNELMRGLITDLEERGRQENVPFWKALAKKLNRPRRKSYEVNLFRLEKYASGKGTVVVPGYVLGTGTISKPVTVAAVKFSRTAEEKIRKAGGKVMDLERFIEGKPDVKNATIMG